MKELHSCVLNKILQNFHEINEKKKKIQIFLQNASTRTKLYRYLKTYSQLPAAIGQENNEIGPLKQFQNEQNMQQSTSTSNHG